MEKLRVGGRLLLLLGINRRLTCLWLNCHLKSLWEIMCSLI